MMRIDLITPDSMVDLIFHLKWNSDLADHTDCFHARQVNIWRDLIPSDLIKSILDKSVGDRIEIPVKSDGILPGFSEGSIFDIRSVQFDRSNNSSDDSGKGGEPRQGRFYPKGRLKGLPNIFSTNVQPFRCVGVKNGNMTIDFNHPLAMNEIKFSALIAGVDRKDQERGGTSIDWIDKLISGPGMQARWNRLPTDFFSNDIFNREDRAVDTDFYKRPRYVHHLDATAREMIKNSYGRFLKDGMSVLDLMSSWETHTPEQVDFDQVIGLGLNQAEMQKNPNLSDLRVHDLNIDPTLPFNSNTFDAVINTVSIEYLIHPVAIFKEVHRVLRPNGRFIISFSNRWFPTKAIKIWSQLHEFERMGLVLEYFSQAGGYDDLHTYSIRGLPRPYDDKYFPKLLYSDPVYVVWGRKR